MLFFCDNYKLKLMHLGSWKSGTEVLPCSTTSTFLEVIVLCTTKSLCVGKHASGRQLPLVNNFPLGVLFM